MGITGDAAAGQEQFMRVALDMAERSLAAGGPPVGACVVRRGADGQNELVAKAQNSVVAELDATAHAEIMAIRAACAELRTLRLADCALFVTVQPCAMCLAACHYAGIETVVYGASIDDFAARSGAELAAPEALFAGQTQAPVVIGGVLREACQALLAEWAPR